MKKITIANYMYLAGWIVLAIVMFLLNYLSHFAAATSDVKYTLMGEILTILWSLYLGFSLLIEFYLVQSRKRCSYDICVFITLALSAVFFLTILATGNVGKLPLWLTKGTCKIAVNWIAILAAELCSLFARRNVVGQRDSSESVQKRK